MELYENRQIPIVYSDDMFDSRIIGMGSKLRGQSVSIMDLMTNDGGKPGAVIYIPSGDYHLKRR